MPSGPHGVGVTTQHLIDTKRIETNAMQRCPRELMLHIWYPSSVRHTQLQTPYDPDALAATQRWISDERYFYFRKIKIPTWLLSGFRLQDGAPELAGFEVYSFALDFGYTGQYETSVELVNAKRA